MDIRTLLGRDTTEYDAYEYLSGFGFEDVPKALANLKLLAGGVESPLLVELLSVVIRACSLSADPDLCLNNFERISSAAESRDEFLSIISWEPESIKVLAPMLSSSKFLTTVIMGDPAGTLGALLAPGALDSPKDKDEMLAGALAACPPGTPLKEAMERLRRFKYSEFLRLTARDLLGRADLAETTLELSNLADSALEAAIGVARVELERKYGGPVYETADGSKQSCPFTVIGMGKLGGQELNFSSDIDIMYLYSSDEGETTGPERITNHQYFVKLGELVTKLIGDKTADGFVFRVDLRLRPEGERGDLAQSLHGYEIYYESWGQTWERSALIKARPSAGDMELGRAFLDTIRPFVYRKYLDYSSISEIRDMKQRIEKAGALKAGKELDLKLGFGGIREVEFFISALQLLYGGREPGIRERGTLKALHRLALKGLITFEEQEDLTRAYEFLRTAEHRLQVVEERQVHSLPNDKGHIRALALRMGFRDAHEMPAEDGFTAQYDRHTRRVRSIYDGLLAERREETTEREEGLSLILSADIAEDEAAGILANEGFRNPRKAYMNVVLLRDGSPGSPITPRSRQLFVSIMPSLVAGCAAAPDPDMAMNNLESFVTSFGSREALYALIKEKPEAAGFITKLFGSSEYFSRLLITHPEMFDLVLLPGEEGLDKDKAQMSAELSDYLAKAESFAERMDLLRRYKHAEEVRVGIKDLLVNPGCYEVSKDLTALAEVVLEASLSMSLDDVEARYGLPDGVKKGEGIAVVGLGKLGARELNYGSDLDIIFIYDAPQKEGGKRGGKAAGKGTMGAPEFFMRASERVIFALSSLTREGFAFRVDTRLRPGGSKGVLAHTLDGLDKYYAKSASTWELQALTRARAVVGDEHLCKRYETLRTEVLTRPKERGRLAAEIKAMRARMEKELAKKAKGRYHVKYGKGGIVDVEFIVQYLQLLNGPDEPGLLVVGTKEALDALAGRGKLDGEDAATLTKSYGFLRELESKIRITAGQADSVIPDDEGRLAMLAARMGYRDLSGGPSAAKGLISDYAGFAGRVWEIFERVIA